MDIHKLPLGETFEAEYVYKYLENRDILLHEMTRANTVLFILKKLHDFPLEKYFPFGSIFLSTVTDSLFDTCIMCLWRISVDESFSTGLTLRKFKNEIFQKLKSDEFKNQFRDELRVLEFNSKVQIVEQQIKDIRHNFIAHLNAQKYPLYLYKGIIWDLESVSALLKYQVELNSLFDVLQFHEKFATQYYEYSEMNLSHAENSKSDVEMFLELIIKNNGLDNPL